MSDVPVTLHRRVRMTLDSLPESDRERLLETAGMLRQTAPDQWPSEKVVRLNGDRPLYMVRVTPDLRAFVERSEANAIQVVDLVREDALQWYLASTRNGGRPE